MKKRIYIIFAFSLVLLVVSLLAFFIQLPPLKEDVLYASVNFTNVIGIDINGTALTFGNVLYGGSVIKSVEFYNGYNIPVLLKISSDGSIKEFLHFDKSVRVEAGEYKKIPFSVTSTGFESGFYEGDVTIKVFKD